MATCEPKARRSLPAAHARRDAVSRRHIARLELAGTRALRSGVAILSYRPAEAPA
jgi:hypothetical protein